MALYHNSAIPDSGVAHSLASIYIFVLLTFTSTELVDLKLGKFETCVLSLSAPLRMPTTGTLLSFCWMISRLMAVLEASMLPTLPPIPTV